MLIRDIELIPAIVDLVDNSVDAARQMAKDGAALGSFHVEIQASRDYFKIVDNSGGIPLELAITYAFRFGRPDDFPGSPETVGQFGVGMKRALFKLGQEFEVRSTTATSTFVLPVNVDEWAKDLDPAWRFAFSVADASYHAKPDEVGTTLSVPRLHPSVSDDLGSASVLGKLRVDLQLRHQVALDEGMRIILNHEDLVGRAPRLNASDEILPISLTSEIDSKRGTKVRLRLYAGVVDVESPGADDVPEAGESVRSSEAGWYLFCQNRLLLSADKTALTGWGDGEGPAYHPQYRNFRGYAFLDGDSIDLPWNTTKTGVDQDSEVFRAAKAKMIEALKSVVSVVNRQKSESERVLPDQQVLNPALAHTAPTALADLKPSAACGCQGRRRRVRP